MRCAKHSRVALVEILCFQKDEQNRTVHQDAEEMRVVGSGVRAGVHSLGENRDWPGDRRTPEARDSPAAAQPGRSRRVRSLVVRER